MIAQRLLGATLATRIGGDLTSGKIVETEAYKAPDDKGYHAYGNKRTARTETMFGAPGKTFINFLLWIHYLFNIITGPVDTAYAVLVRAVEPLDGLDIMCERRSISTIKSALTNGPGKCTAALGITKDSNGQSFLDPLGAICIKLSKEIADDQVIKVLV